MRPYPELDGVEHHFAELSTGIRMHYAEAGDPTAPPAVLVHGWPQHWYCWRKVIPLLAPRFRVIAIDLRGFGWSDAPRTSYSKQELGEDVIALVEALDLRDVRLVGHDWGGAAVFRAALHSPERLHSVLALSIVHPWAKGTPSPMSVATALAYQPAIATPVLGPALQRFTPWSRAITRLGGTNRWWSPEARDSFLSQFRDADHAEAASRVYRTFLLRELRQKPPRGRMPVPARLVVGRSDPIVRPNLFSPRDDIELEFVPGGHWLPDQHPEYVAERLGSGSA